MQPCQSVQSRINLSDMKAQIVKKLGPEQSRRYFYYLNRLLSRKLSKSEFDKLCIRTVGRENLKLHNQLIRSILKNVCNAKVPPPIHEKEALSKSRVSVENGYQQSGTSVTSTLGPTRSNGEVLPMSPRKSRSVHDRRTRDRPSPLGTNGKTEIMSDTSTAASDGNVKVITENVAFKLCDFQRPLQNQHGLAEQPEQDSLLQRPTKRLRTTKSPDHPVHVHNKDHQEADIFRNGGEVQQDGNLNPARNPLRAPLGIPFCSASVGGTRRALPSYSNSNTILSSDSCELFDTETLRKRMEQIVGAEGLEGVSLDCANLLNNGLNVYLKRLIGSCIALVGSRFGHEPQKQLVNKQPTQGKTVNGSWPGHQLQMPNGVGTMGHMEGQKICCPISLLNFKVAVELNPQQLGEDWPLLLEKTCMYACE